MKKDSRGYFREKGVYKDMPYDFRAKTKAGLREKVQRFMDETDSGIVDEETTVRQWCDIWLETYKRGSVGVSRYRSCCYYVNIICREIGGKKIGNIKPVDLQKILNAQTGAKDTAMALRSVMSDSMRCAKENNVIRKNPAESLKIPKLQNGSHRAITETERELILRACDGHPATNWVLLMLFCGLRPSEASAIQEKDIDLDNRIVHVTKAFETDTGDIKEPKTSSGIRDVPVPEELAQRLILTGNPFAYTTLTSQGNLVNTRSKKRRLWLSFRRHMNEVAGSSFYQNRLLVDVVAKDLTPYCLRHTYCTDLQAAGVPINVAKELMGHSNISMTSRIYTHKSETATRNALEKINSFHNKSGTNWGTSQKKASN